MRCWWQSTRPSVIADACSFEDSDEDGMGNLGGILYSDGDLMALFLLHSYTVAHQLLYGGAEF